MSKTYSPTFVALGALLVLALAPPAGAADSSLSEARQQRDAARQKQAQVAAQLDSLQASDAQLEAAVGVLDGQVRFQRASADAAGQAVQAALAAVALSQARIAATEKEHRSLQAAVVGRAVSVYVRPEEPAFTEVIDAKDLNEASRRSTLLNQVNSNDRNVMDRLRAVREDLADEQARLKKAQSLAADRRSAEENRLAELRTAQDQYLRLADALQARIGEYQAEASQVAQQEASLSALIRAREQALAAAQVTAQAQLPAPAGPAPQRGGPGAPRGGGGRDPGIDVRVSGAGLSWPLRGPVTSPFGTRWGRLHAGIDIGGGMGAPIRAAKGGTVIFAGSMSGYGNAVIINHGGGLSTLYAHQSRLGVGNGAPVSQGQVIGFVGSTGHSTGPHLHFETRVGGSPRNPMQFLP